MKLTLYLYKEYNDELAYGEEYTELIVKKSHAEARLKERVKKAYRMSLEEMREDPMFDNDTLDDDYVSIQNDGDDVSSFIIEEKSVELSEEEVRQLAAKLNAFLEHRAEEQNALFREEGIREGLLRGMTSLVQDGILTAEEAAARADVPVEVLQRRLAGDVS